jgi:hypothetical protein
MKNEPSLSGVEIKERVLKKLDEYKGLGHLENYAMFMGKAQLLEMALKSLLQRKYDVPEEFMEKWTLGRVKKELSDKGLRPDFIALLKSVVEHRNYIAHEFLANNAITQSMANFSDRKLYGDLFRATYELEQIIILYDWCEDNNSWGQT